MCRKYLVNCGYCWRSSQPKATIIVNCQNRQHGIFRATIDNSDVIFAVKPFHPCTEMQETREVLCGTICHECYDKEGRPSPDPKEAEMGEKIINNLVKSDSMLTNLARSGSVHTQTKIRVEGERRKELDKIQSAIDTYRATNFFESSGEGFRMESNHLIKLIRAIMIFNIVTDADEKYGAVDENSLPSLLRELLLTRLTEKDCNICGDEIGKTSPEKLLENPVQTPCGHIFGDRCIFKWLQETREPSCPMCRFCFSTRNHRFPDGYDDGRNDEDDGEEEDEEGFPEDWLEMLMEAANSERATDSEIVVSANFP